MKNIIACIFLIFLIISCSTENGITRKENVQDPIEHFIIDYNTYLQKAKPSSNSFTSPKYGLRENRITPNGFIRAIDSTQILAFEFEKVQTYTFKVVTTRSNRNTFTNLVVRHDSRINQTTEQLFEYLPDQRWIDNPMSIYSGVINQIDDQGNVQESYSNTTQSLPCDAFTYTVEIPCSDAGHMPGDDNCECGKSVNCSPAQVFTVYVIDCMQTGGGGGGSGGGVTNTGGWLGNGGTPSWAAGPFYPTQGIGSSNPTGNDTPIATPGGVNFQPEGANPGLLSYPFNRPNLTPSFGQALHDNNLEDWWNDGVNFSKTNVIYNWLSQNFNEEYALWCAQFLHDNPTMSAHFFEDHFLNVDEEGMSDGSFDETPTGDPNYPQQSLPSWYTFVQNFPALESPLVYWLAGGQLLADRNATLTDSNTFNDNYYNNACAVRLSYALNRSGVVIPYLPGKTVPGDPINGQPTHYFLVAKEMVEWMCHTFGTSDGTCLQNHSNVPISGNNFKMPANQFGPNMSMVKPHMEGFKGIFNIITTPSWATGHCDAFNNLNYGPINSSCLYNCHLDDAPIQAIYLWYLQ